VPDTTPATDLDGVLRAHGHRVTRQRRLVWEALRGSDRHLTVDELAADLSNDVDIASIYRTLGLFEELGVARVSRFHDDGASRWESAHPDEHFHLVCTRCGEVDHHVGSLVANIRSHLEEGHGFEVADVDLAVRGTCARCRAGSDEA